MNDPTTSIYLRNARRQICHALSTGKEHDLYGAIYQLIGHCCHLATIEDHQRVAYYCDPQGILAFDMQVSRSEREGFNDPDYAPSISSMSGNSTHSDKPNTVAKEGEDAAKEDEDTTEEDEGEAEEEDEAEEEEGYVRLTRGAKLGTHLPSKHVPAVDPTVVSSAGATSSSASTMFNHTITRYPDYRLVKAYLDDKDNERVRYNVAVVEVKIFNPNQRRVWTDVNSTAQNMLPQVIQAVQVIFAKHESYDEVVAIPVVNEYCKFMYFHRSNLPEFNTANFDPRGYQEPGRLEGKTLAKKLEKYAYKISGHTMIKMVYGIDGDGGKSLAFGAAFLRHWGEFLTWTERVFPEQPKSL